MNGMRSSRARSFAMVGWTLAAAACMPLPTEPGEPVVAEQPAPPVCPALDRNRVLVDATHDGGAWWFPQSGPFVAADPHQGKALADHLRARGFRVDELGRGERVTESALLGYATVIRAGQYGGYAVADVDAYERFTACPRTLILLGEFLRQGEIDAVAERLGLGFSGTYSGPITLAAHPITAGVPQLGYGVGSALTGYDAAQVTVLGRVLGLPVMGLLGGRAARIFFMGDVNTLETVPQPLVDNLVAWGF